MKISKATKRSTSVLAFAAYRQEVERPLFSPFSAYLAINGDESPASLTISGMMIGEELRKFEAEGYVQRMASIDHATLEQHPYIQELNHGRHPWFGITDSGVEHLADRLAGTVTGKPGNTLRDIIKPEEVALTIARMPVVQEAIWEGLSGFPIGDTNPVDVQPHS